MSEKIKILIAGGTGLIGTRLIEYLSPEKFTINILSRKSHESHDNVTYFVWEPDKLTMDEGALDGVTVVINLAGAGIADKKWTEDRKKMILSSRINACETISNSLKKLKSKPSLYFGASAVGIYGNRDNEILKVHSEIGSGFLADVTEKWEAANSNIISQIDRHVILRIGIVLSTKGGALKEILKPANAGVFGYFGNGKAYYSWIHIDDICQIIEESITSSTFSGTYNGTAPTPVTIYDLVKSVKENKKGFGLLLPIPKLALKIAMGEMADMLFNSTRAIPTNLLEDGYKFKFDSIDAAIKDLLNL